MSLLRTLAQSTRFSATLALRTAGTASTTTRVAPLGLSSFTHRHYSSSAVADTAATAVSEDTPTAYKTSLYTFEDMSEQEVLFAEMRHHRMSWGSIGQYFGKSSLEVFYGYIPIATRAYKHQWTSRMAEQDVLRCMQQRP
ncbi:hypothetical protein BGX24_012182 [Mortierella sp. AD032]|nr:hypothetical protein BGX24_012182 [Mortierella sp. AD032]